MKETDGKAGHPALTDAQTGLPNKLHWDTVFDVVFAAGDRGIPLTVIFLEIDGYPEWIGKHTVDDRNRVLAALGPVLGATIRQSDLVARTGDQRFSLLLLDCNLAGGRLVADRLDLLLDPLRKTWGLGFSMGVATFHREMEEPLDLAAEAEGALRTAQARGENQTEFFG